MSVFIIVIIGIAYADVNQGWLVADRRAIIVAVVVRPGVSAGPRGVAERTGHRLIDEAITGERGTGGRPAIEHPAARPDKVISHRPVGVRRKLDAVASGTHVAGVMDEFYVAPASRLDTVVMGAAVELDIVYI